MKTNDAMVNQMRSWLGKNEKDGSYKEIIDIYNSQPGPFPRGIRMQYNWSWCACTVSAAGIKLGYTDIIPIEISCGEMIKKAMDMGIWQENDGYIPFPGELILYDWDDSGKGDNTGWPDHIGVIEDVNTVSNYMTVIEGNYSDSVKRRTISINGKYIRGFITPKYDSGVLTVPEVAGAKKTVAEVAREVIAGKWGSGVARKNALEKAGYDYATIQAEVNKVLNGSAVIAKDPVQSQDQPVEKYVTATCAARSKDSNASGAYETTANLYCRNDAGSDKKALCQIPKGTKVMCYGYYSLANSTRWLYIQFTMDGVRYTGFSSSNYLKKI